MPTLPVAFLLVYDAIILIGVLCQTSGLQKKVAPLLLLFFCSGMPALIYQIVWQRALFAIYGVNSESVAAVVSAFMIGLGLGSLLGGWLSARYQSAAIFIFALAELGTAAFGLLSLRIFHWAALHTAGAPLGYVVPLSLGLLLLPTMCMGATLPLLTDYMVRGFFPVGYSVGVLYFANTFGSAVACYFCGTFLLRDLGQSGAVRIAAVMNLLVGITAVIIWRQKGASEPTERGNELKPLLGLRGAAALSGVTAFVSLGLEIVWFRVFVLASEDRAPAFALLLATFLAGVAGGAFIGGRMTEKKTAGEIGMGVCMLLAVAGGISPLLIPAVAFLKWKGLNYLLAASGFFLVAAVLGAAFPLLCRLAMGGGSETGRKVSLIYVSNIAGSAAGSLLIGFVLMNYMGLQALAFLLGGISLAAGLALVAVLPRGIVSRVTLVSVCGIALVAFALAPKLYPDFQRRLNLGIEANEASSLVHLVENRSGIIAVLANDEVLGSGVYDGSFSTDPVHDKNRIVRAFAVGAFHPSPKRILLIGLSSGSWAQVLVHYPGVELLEAVEINPGYLGLIAKYPVVSSLLNNPKFKIHIDDGRRWMLSHPDRQYDLIVQNNSFYWRDHSAQLLSTDYLKIVKEHLAAGGAYYYNTTGSDDVMATGLAVFPHGLRVLNFLAVSESPLKVDKERWKSVLRGYSIDGRAVFQAGDSGCDSVLREYEELANTVERGDLREGMETSESIRRRIKNPLIITDDNMGWEWR